MKVHIPHVPTRYDPITDRRVPSLNLTPAADWGELNVLLPDASDVRVADLQGEVDQIRERINKEFDAGDYICCVGDPILLAATIAAAARLANQLAILRWDRHQKRYIVSEVYFDE